MTRNIIVFLLCIVVVVAIAIPFLLERQTDAPIAMDRAEAVDVSGYHIIESAYWAVPTEGEAARRADLIAVAEVNERLPAFWSTPNNERPNLTEIDLLKSPQYRIYTPYKLRITQAIKGQINKDEIIELNRLGGEIGNDIVSVEDDLFELQPGMNIVVFLRDCGEKRTLSLGSPGAQYRIITRFVIDDNGNLSDSDYNLNQLIEVVGQEGTLDAKGGEVGCG